MGPFVSKNLALSELSQSVIIFQIKEEIQQSCSFLICLHENYGCNCTSAFKGMEKTTAEATAQVYTSGDRINYLCGHDKCDDGKTLAQF